VTLKTKAMMLKIQLCRSRV